MKYVLLLVFLAAVAGIQFFLELSSHEAPVSLMCTAADSKSHPLADVLRQHLHSHR